MIKILLSLLILCAANTYVFAQSTVAIKTEKLELSADDKSILFENLIRKFNISIETKSTAVVLSYLNEAEVLLSFFKKDKHRSAQANI